MSPGHLEEKKMLSLQLQQAAFENVYLKAQEGMQLVRSAWWEGGDSHWPLRERDMTPACVSHRKAEPRKSSGTRFSTGALPC